MKSGWLPAVTDIRFVMTPIPPEMGSHDKLNELYYLCELDY